MNGAWIAFCGDNHLSAIEVFPQGTDITEADGYDGFKGVTRPQLRPTATHVALAAKLLMPEIEAIAAREGWRTKVVSRGNRFQVIEMWINNCHLLEWLTPEMQEPYDNTVQGMLAATSGLSANAMASSTSGPSAMVVDTVRCRPVPRAPHAR